MCQPAIDRFKWELEISLTRMISLGITDIVVLLTDDDRSISSYIRRKYGVEVHSYSDRRKDFSYIPSIKPYLWAKYLQEDRTREKGVYFYLDSDVIFREVPSIVQNGDIWYGSNCESYLGLEYIDSHGPNLVESMCNVMGIDPTIIRSNNPVCGAQWVIENPTFEYWLKVYEDSIKLYRYLSRLEDCDIQIWTAEMWAQLWNVYHFGKTTEVHSELDFCWATDDVEEYYKTKIYHNAGVLETDKDLFFKGQYVNKSPFNDDLSFVNPNKASIKYVEAIRQVKH